MALFEEMRGQGNWLFRYRGVLPLFILAMTLLTYLDELNDGEIAANHGRGDLMLLSVSVIGLLIRIFTVGYAATGTSGRNTATQRADALNTKGIYSIVRHPLYLGNFMMWLGLCLLTREIPFILFFTALYWLYYERIMLAEEEYLREKFGTEYERWAAATPAFIPSLRMPDMADLNFDWKKVVRNEKSGILALAVVFAFLEISGDAFMLHRFVVHLFWLIPLTIAACYYALIKTLVKVHLL